MEIEITMEEALQDYPYAVPYYNDSTTSVSNNVLNIIKNPFFWALILLVLLTAVSSVMAILLVINVMLPSLPFNFVTGWYVVIPLIGAIMTLFGIVIYTLGKDSN